MLELILIELDKQNNSATSEHQLVSLYLAVFIDADDESRQQFGRSQGLDHDLQQSYAIRWERAHIASTEA